MHVDFHRRVRAGFLEIAKREPQRCVVIDGAGTPAEVAARLCGAVKERIASD